MKFRYLLENFFSHPHCISCDVPLSICNRYIFCEECGKDLPLITGKTCRVCGKPINENADDVCIRCKSRKNYFISNVARYTYKGCVKNAIQNMKFRNQDYVAYELGKQLCKTVSEKYGDIDFDFVTYVPMTKLSEILRTFHQTFEFAYAISKYLKIPICDNVLRKLATVKTQSGLSKKDRVENVKNGFYVAKPNKVIDKTILLIDDVMTTGSTLNECAKILKKAGAVAVYTATIAIAVLDE